MSHPLTIEIKVTDKEISPKIDGKENGRRSNCSYLLLQGMRVLFREQRKASFLNLVTLTLPKSLKLEGKE